MFKTLRISLFLVAAYIFIGFVPFSSAAVDVCEPTYSYSKGVYVKKDASFVCGQDLKFTLTLRDVSGNLLPGLKFELYEQGIDANGLPLAGNRVGGGTISNSGQANFSFKPDQCKTYALKVWDRRSDQGEFWFFDATRFVCDYDRYVTKYLPALKIVLRDSQGQLKKNYNFSLYSQKYDVDNNPIFENKDLIANLQTDAGGQAIIYVAPYNPYRRGQSGFYVLSAKDANGNVSTVYNIQISADRDYTFQHAFSGLAGELRNARGQLKANKEIRLYEQITSSTGRSLGRQLMKIKTNDSGRFQFEYPAGAYAFAVLDDFNRENIFWNVAVKPGGNYQKLVTNLTTFSLSDTQGEGLPKDASLKLYSFAVGDSDNFYRDKEVGVIKLSSNKMASLSLAEGPYLAFYAGKNNQEYGQAFYAKNGKTQTVKVIVGRKYLLAANQPFKISGTSVSPVSSSSVAGSSSLPSSSSFLSSRLSGRILLQVEDKGQAWYVNPADNKKYYLGRPQDALNLMRRFGLGISNNNFAALEKNPGAWRQLAGKILIKTEDSGKAYYFDPVNLRLDYLGRPQDAFNVMRIRGLGIKNSDLNQVITGN